MNAPVRTAAEAAAARKDAPWGSLNWLASGELGNIDRLTLGRVVIRQGQANPRHRHTNCDEVLYLLRGRLEHSLDNETVTVEAGDTLSVPAGVWHHAVSTGDEDADMIVAYNAGQRTFEEEA